MAFSRVTLNMPAINHLIAGGSGPVVPQMLALTARVATAARGRVRGKSGSLGGSIQTEVVIRGLIVIGRVFSNLPYAIYVHEGTGIYAGRGMITPKRAKFLVFVPTGASTPVFAKQTKGQPPNPFLFYALQTTVPWPVRRLKGNL
jgi:hypothetical protein